MKCTYCLEAEEKRHTLYADDDLIVSLKELAFTPGHIIIFPRQHYTIVEQVPDTLWQRCSVLANKVGRAIFESMGVQGTNVLVHNGLGAGQGVPHVAIEVIPRQPEDGLPLQWQGQQMSEEELSITLAKLQEEGETASSETVPVEKKGKDDPVEQISEEGENYLLKSLRKIP